MTVRKYKHLKEDDRLKIYELLFEGCSLQTIAERIGYHKSTIYRELSCNSTRIGYCLDFAAFLSHGILPCSLCLLLSSVPIFS